MFQLPKEIIIDDELSLTLLCKEDAEQLFYLAENNRKYLSSHVLWVNKINSIKDEEAFIEHCINGANKFLCAHYAIKMQHNDIIGSIAFNKIDEPSQEAHIGYWLSPAYQNQGIMSKSVNALIDTSLKTTILRNFIIETSSGNISSQKLALRNNFFLCKKEKNLVEESSPMQFKRHT